MAVADYEPGKAIITATPGAEHDTIACVKWVRSQIRGSTLQEGLERHRALVAGGSMELTGLDSHSDWKIRQHLPASYSMTFIKGEEVSYTNVHDWGEYQLLLVNGAQCDEQAAIEFCKLLLSGHIPLPYYPACG